jgi:hypothetical protein
VSSAAVAGVYEYFELGAAAHALIVFSFEPHFSHFCYFKDC